MLWKYLDKKHVFLQFSTTIEQTRYQRKRNVQCAKILRLYVALSKVCGVRLAWQGLVPRVKWAGEILVTKLLVLKVWDIVQNTNGTRILQHQRSKSDCALGMYES